jgi:hypothetical protein
MKTLGVLALVWFSAMIAFGDAAAWLQHLTASHARAWAAVQARWQPPCPHASGAAPATARLAPPPNDNFIDRIALYGAEGTAAGSIAEAGMEPGEPWHNSDHFGTNSVWWAWTAPADGVFNFDTAPSLPNAILTVYSGTDINALTRVAQTRMRVMAAHVLASAGTIYRIAVCGASSTDQGAITVRYYPESISDWFVMSVSTNARYFPMAAPDGSACFAPGSSYLTYLARTNIAGLVTETSAGLVADTHGVTIRTKDGTLLLNNAALPGMSNPYAVFAYDGRALLAFDYAGARLVLYKVSRHGVEAVAEQVIPAAAMIAGGVLGKTIRVMLMEMAIMEGTMRMGVLGFDKNLRRQLWSVPVQDGAVQLFLLSNDVLCRRMDGYYNVTATVYRKGIVAYTHVMPLPACPDVGLVETAPDARGGLAWWIAQDQTTYHTNSPLSYLDHRGVLMLNNQTPPATDGYWGYEACDGKLLYLSRPDGLNRALIAYKMRPTLTERGRQLFANLDAVLLADGAVSIASSDDNPPPAMNGLTQYDKNLRREKWNNAMTRGDELDYLGRATYARSTVEDAGAFTNMLVNIFNKRGTIADHPFIY